MTSARRLMLAIATLLGLVLTALVVPAAGAGASPTLTKMDTAFMRNNAQVNMAEMTIGRIALHRSHDAAVLDLAMVTISDHRYAMSQLNVVARQLGVALPSMPSAGQRRLAAKLKTVPLAKFDHLYLSAQVAGHEGSIADTKAEIAGGTNPDVIAYATAYLPFAQSHLAMALAALAGEG